MRTPPGRRAAPRRGELARNLARRVETLRRQQAEQNHGARPFVEDRDDHTHYREITRQVAERRLGREFGRGAEIARGRGLER